MAKKAYISVNTPTPIYGISIGSVNISSSNMTEYFSTKIGNFHGSTQPVNTFEWKNGKLTSNNYQEDGYPAELYMTALVDMTIEFKWGVSSETNYDKLNIRHLGTDDKTVIATLVNNQSGEKSGSSSANLKAGQSIHLDYSKDGSQYAGSDSAWISDVVLSGVETTVITGYEYKDVARKVKKAYVGIQQFEPRELPEGYTQVEYIESSGTQYVDTGVSISASKVPDLKIICDCQWVNINGDNGVGTAGSGNIFWFGCYQKYIYYGNGTNDVKLTNEQLYDGKRHVWTLDGYNGTFSVSGLVSLTGLNFKAPTVSANCLLPYRGDGLLNFGTQIYSANTLIRDYVPCINSSGVAGLYDLVNHKFYGNSGSGTFATAVSASSTARKIKKGYIGIGGVARPFMSGGELAYYGTITALQLQRYDLAATTVGNYALFGGGNNNNTAYALVDAYDTSLVKSSPTDLSNGRWQLAATSVGSYALFGGGATRSGANATVDTYNTSLTKGTATALSQARSLLAATSVGNYALFGGGYNNGANKATVDAYNKSLSRTTPTALNNAKYRASATTVGNYALFGGGTTGNYHYPTVDAYDTSLTRTIPTELSTGRYDLAATTVGNYALFGGGYSGSTSKVVDAYNESLTRTKPTALSTARFHLSATTVGNYALFGGGYNYTTKDVFYATVDVYDKSLTRTTSTNLNVARRYLAATTVGNYALFGGGLRGNGESSPIVDAFVVA